MGPAWPGSFFLLLLARDAETRPAARRGFPVIPVTSRGVRPTGVISAMRRIHTGRTRPPRSLGLREVLATADGGHGEDGLGARVVGKMGGGAGSIWSGGVGLW